MGPSYGAPEDVAGAIEARGAERRAQGRFGGITGRLGLNLGLSPMERSRLRRGAAGERLLGRVARRAVNRGVTLEDLAGAIGENPALLGAVFANRGRYGRALSRL